MAYYLIDFENVKSRGMEGVELLTEEKPQAGAEESGTPETTGPVENTEPVETVEQKDAPAEPEQGTPEETGKAEEIDTTNGEEKYGLLSD